MLLSFSASLVRTLRWGPDTLTLWWPFSTMGWLRAWALGVRQQWVQILAPQASAWDKLAHLNGWLWGSKEVMYAGSKPIKSSVNDRPLKKWTKDSVKFLPRRKHGRNSLSEFRYLGNKTRIPKFLPLYSHLVLSLSPVSGSEHIYRLHQVQAQHQL